MRFLVNAATLSICAMQVLVADVSFDTSGISQGAINGGTDNFLIPAESGTVAGSNLFHSFANFSLEREQSATFQDFGPGGGPSIANILARVTGGGVSTINGKIVSEIEGANLFLMNPKGIMFGQGAQLEVGGSFRATTADYLLFRDAAGKELGKFWASGGNDVSVLVSPPSAFGFAGAGSAMDGGIVLSGVQEVIDERNFTDLFGRYGERGAKYLRRVLARSGIDTLGSDLSLVGRAVVVDESVVETGGGDLALVAVGADAVEVAMGDLDVAAGGTGRGPAFAGPIEVRHSVLSSVGDEPYGSGAISMSGGRVAVIGALQQTVLIPIDPPGDENIVLAQTQGGVIVGGVSGSTPNRVLVRSTGDVVLDQLGRLQSASGNTLPGAEIVIDAAGELRMSAGGAIASQTTAASPGGRIGVLAGSLKIIGGEATDFTGILTRSADSGTGGDLAIEIAGSARIEEVGQISTLSVGSGTGGSVELSAQSLRIVGAANVADDPRPNFFLTGINSKSSIGSTGTLGNLTIDVREAIRLERGGLIDATTFSGDPNAGAARVSVTAGEITGDRAGSLYFTGIGSNSALGTGGSAGGMIVVSAERIALHNGAQIAASTRGSAKAGDIVVNADRISASGSGLASGFVLSEESGIVAGSQGRTVDFPNGSSGNAGQVTVRPLGPVSGGGTAIPMIALSNGGEIAARAEGSGDGGNVMVDWVGGDIRVESGGRISARSGVEGGIAGSVVVTARNLIVTSGGAIESQNEEPLPPGGNPVVAPGGSVPVIPPGSAGGVELTIGDTLTMDGGVLRVSSLRGDAGTLRIVGGEMLDVDRSRMVAEAYLDGGNITVEQGRYFLLDGSEVNADANVGTGGNIQITSQVFLQNESVVTADSQSGAPGVVRIDPQAVLSGNEGEVEVEPLDASDSLQPECTNRLPEADPGSFIKAGRGGTRRLPGGYLPSLRLVRIEAD